MIKRVKKVAICLALAMTVTQATPISHQIGTTITVEAAQRKGTVNSAVYMRSSANSSSAIVATLRTNEQIVVLDSSGGWYKVQANGKTGYVWKSFITLGTAITEQENTSEQSGKVTALWVAVRSQANFTSSVKKVLIKGSKVTVKASSGSFYKVESGNQTGYVAKKYIKIVQNEVPSTQKPDDEAITTDKTEQGNPTTKVTGQDVVNYAVKFLGNPYIYGGTSLTNGTDCSGFTMSVYKYFGYTIPRTSYAQRFAGTKVANLSQAKPGDLICYSGHVALYMGNNKIVHASTYKTGIIIGNNASYRPIVAIRRIIN
ncbi:MAG: SH3 domain-containing protein [Lachnospiraceae bacterium]